jgi:hemerythrin-like domain-containing protein
MEAGSYGRGESGVGTVRAVARRMHHRWPVLLLAPFLAAGSIGCQATPQAVSPATQEAHASHESHAPHDAQAAHEGHTREAAPTSATDRPTEPFRREHAEIKEHLAHLGAELAELGTSSPEQQRAIMQHTVQFFVEHIEPHAAWEERVLYPVVDARAGSGENRFTATMRYEHGVVGRWTKELQAIAAQPSPDVKSFTRRAYGLLGLLEAHFEEEEQVLLPILDRTMSKEEFEREIGAHH